MTDNAEPPEPRTRSSGERRGLHFAVALIVVALTALVVVPLVLQHRTIRVDEHRNDVAQPARDKVNTVHLALARQMSALRGFVISGEEAFLDRYEEALMTERRAYAELEPLMEELSPEAREAFSELLSRADTWHERIADAEILNRQLVPREFIDRLRSEEVLYEETLESAGRLRERIVEEVERDRRELQREERVGLVVTVLLSLLALGAALGALWLGRHLRAAAVAAESRRVEVERVAEDRSRLMRGITHDLKNPLGAARGHLQLLLAGIVDDAGRRRESLERGERAIDVALAIIDDLLELSRAEDGALHIAEEPTDVSAVVRETAEDQRREAEGAGLAFDVDVGEDLPTLSTDGRRVREIVRNLVSNAVKYTPEGGAVKIQARLRAREPAERDGAARVAVDVIDTGPGIPPGEHERIFREFSRLGDRREAEGTGLGLAISRQTARLLGGDIEVESEVGRGSIFTLWLPVDGAD